MSFCIGREVSLHNSQFCQHLNNVRFKSLILYRIVKFRPFFHFILFIYFVYIKYVFSNVVGQTYGQSVKDGQTGVQTYYLLGHLQNLFSNFLATKMYVCYCARYFDAVVIGSVLIFFVCIFIVSFKLLYRLYIYV